MNTDVLCQLKSLWQAAFQEPAEAIDGFFTHAFSPDRCKYTLENGQVVSALYWFDCTYDGGKLAYIYAVATHPDHRGKGLASRLISQTHDHLRRLGYAGAVLKPATGLFPFYERLGYVTSGFVSRFSAESASVPIPVQRLSVAEYAPLRRSYLPENGILQEGVTLDYLSTFADFYASTDALLCVARGEPVIFEYLGNPHSAPGILAALGIKQAQIPTSGDDVPFAMWHPLNCTKTPRYLGLSLE